MLCFVDQIKGHVLFTVCSSGEPPQITGWDVFGLWSAQGEVQDYLLCRG